MPREMTRAPGAGVTPGYLPGFGNDFETEALPEALPRGQNSPQKCNYGLYAEQLVRHGLHRAPRPERAQLVLPHPAVGETHRAVSEDRHAVLALGPGCRSRT